MASKVSPTDIVGPPPKRKHPFIIYYLAMCATVGGALFGYDTGIINGANLLVKKDFDLTDAWIEHIVSSAVGAAAVFSLMSGVIADAVGRKVSIMGAAVVFTAGGILMGFASSKWMLLYGRLAVGAAIGVVSSVVPVYVSECSPPDIRGCLITLNQLFITLGIWISAILAAAFQGLDQGWRYMLGLAALPGIAQFICFLALPESPRWQVMKNNIPKAKLTLIKIRGTEDVTEELDDIIVSLEEEKKTKGWRIWTGIMKTPHVRYTLFVGCMLQVFQQFCGINTVIYYSSNILKSAGFDVRLAIWLSVIPFTVNFLATFIGLWAVEALGRTKVLAVSYLGIAVALWVLVAAFLPVYLHPPATNMMHEVNVSGPCLAHSDCWDCTRDADCAFCAVKTSDDMVKDGSCLAKGKGNDVELFSRMGRCSKKSGTEDFMGGKGLMYAHGYCPTKFAWLAVVGLILFVLGFAPGAGPMPWTINAEIYPLWCRSVANSIATVCNWASNYIVSNTFLTVTKLITSWGTFLGFSVICLISAAFTLLVVPETKNLTLEEIELLFMSKEAQKNARERLDTVRHSLEHVGDEVRILHTEKKTEGDGGDAEKLEEAEQKKDSKDAPSDVPPEAPSKGASEKGEEAEAEEAKAEEAKEEVGASAEEKGADIEVAKDESKTAGGDPTP
ncbi:hypothetical protein RRG08_003873 [Elysia crispata]|uniref:Major facilitator superfamily (MFS) profile domain-containing protein n=1 Tax=Elysia crispata TaxID=231223 RepID=A0AAE1DEL0_9GAST|nr:hypothetical protein RRG08_003873 [Elysia crispata]